MENYWLNKNFTLYSLQFTVKKLLTVNCILLTISCTLLFQQTSASEPSVQLVWLYTINGYGGHDYFVNPQGIWFDSYRNEILIADTDNDSIGIFDTNGNLRFRFGHEKRVSSPISVATDSAGNIYWSEANTSKVKQADFRGELVKEYDFSKLTVGQNQIFPGKLFVNKTDNLYMVDRASGQVVKLNPEEQFITALEGIQESPLQSKEYAGLQITQDGKLYLLSSLGKAMHVFDTTNHLIESFGEHGPQEYNVSFPTAFAIDGKERIWIVDSFQNRLKLFSANGDYLFQLGATGNENGQFYFPIDMVFDSQGRVYVLEKGTNRVQVFEIKE
jgi:sugar lactone lactonase YvrE